MKNRAKCKLCQEIIESFHMTDYVTCRCEEIAISGGNMHYQASAKDFKNFLRVDDNGHEIEVTVQEKEDVSDSVPHQAIDIKKADLLKMLDEMRKRYEELPTAALFAPITHADLASLLMLLSAIFKT